MSITQWTKVTIIVKGQSWACFARGGNCSNSTVVTPTAYLTNLFNPSSSLSLSSGTSDDSLPAPDIGLSANGDSLDNISIVLPFLIPEVVHSSLKLKICFNDNYNISLDQSNLTINDYIITANLTGMDILGPGSHQVTYSISFFGEPLEMSPPKIFESKLANNH